MFISREREDKYKEEKEEISSFVPRIYFQRLKKTDIVIITTQKERRRRRRRKKERRIPFPRHRIHGIFHAHQGVEVRVHEGWKHSNNLDFAETHYITFAIDRGALSPSLSLSLSLLHSSFLVIRARDWNVCVHVVRRLIKARERRTIS